MEINRTKDIDVNEEPNVVSEINGVQGVNGTNKIKINGTKEINGTRTWSIPPWEIGNIWMHLPSLKAFTPHH